MQSHAANAAPLRQDQRHGPGAIQQVDAAVDDGFANRGDYRGVANGTPTSPNSDPIGINYDGAGVGIVAAPLF